MPPTTDNTSPIAAPRHGKSALIVSHAQHVFKVLGWVARQSCDVHVLTDGSGAGPWGKAHTAQLGQELPRHGGRQGDIFGLLPDKAIYDSLLRRDAKPLTGIVDRLAAAFVRDGIAFVFGDAAEGYNPAHDLCRYMIDAAVTIAGRATGRRIASYEIFLAEWLDAAGKAPRAGDLGLRLDDCGFDRKLALALQFSGWQPEVLAVIAKFGADYFRNEYLRPVTAFAPPLHDGTPEYEAFGVERVAAGNYAEVIRYRRHVRPMLDAIRTHAATGQISALEDAGVGS